MQQKSNAVRVGFASKTASNLHSRALQELFSFVRTSAVTQRCVRAASPANSHYFSVSTPDTVPPLQPEIFRSPHGHSRALLFLWFHQVKHDATSPSTHRIKLAVAMLHPTNGSWVS
ncbi:hypothetical protein GW17_00058773 [Ensete ventricosum]|uniref:Uncharacterized protein n=1 Tax=Ensete ventricosum TaxID=4639 RepID=A0A444C2H3_ENSVE|nr:hypothetical protein GW17_00058773 [Ensete ventricosum]RZR72579.1 hypothetical protein BHM03_00014747 [Ensete ventricosum]